MKKIICKERGEILFEISIFILNIHNKEVKLCIYCVQIYECMKIKWEIEDHQPSSKKI